MDRNIKRAYDDIILEADTLKNEILRLEKELSDLQDRYDILEEEKEDSYQKGYNDGINA